jgi:hypothetical protein
LGKRPDKRSTLLLFLDVFIKQAAIFCDVLGSRAGLCSTAKLNSDISDAAVTHSKYDTKEVISGAKLGGG